MHFPHNEAQRNECDVWCDIYRWHQKCLWICKNTGWQDGSRNLAVEEYSCPVTTQSTLPESHKFPKKKKKKGRNINRARSKHKLLGLALPHSNPYFLFIYFWTVCDIMKPLSPPEYVWMFVPHLVLLVWCFYYCYLLLQEPGYMGAQLMLANKPYGSSSCPKNLLISVNSA